MQQTILGGEKEGGKEGEISLLVQFKLTVTCDAMTKLHHYYAELQSTVLHGTALCSTVMQGK